MRVDLIDRSDAFTFGFSKLDFMVGTRTWDDVRLPYDADVLVVALGADLAPEHTPGLVECGHEFYSPAGVAAIREVLRDFPGGDIVIGVLDG